MKIAFAEPDLPRSGAAVAGIWEGGGLTPGARRLDEATDGAITRALAGAARFSGKKGELLAIVAPAKLPLSRIVVAGLGKREKADARLYEDLGGALAAHLNGAGETEATIAGDVAEEAPIAAGEAAAALAFGAALRTYRFDKYKTKQKPEQKRSLAQLTVSSEASDAAERAYRPLQQTAEAVFFTRDLVSEPANVIYPETLAAEARTLEKFGVAVEVLDEKAMRELGMGALLGVAQGSARPPRLVVMQWRGAGRANDQPGPLAFIGKGVTFDTGGISIKPAAGMGDMKWDMAGSAVVIGLMRLLAARKAKVNAVGIVGLVENMPSGTAQRPGDIVTSMSGQTIEVLNTDAEGRLVLADAMWYCQDRFKPRLMVDLATLTGAVIVALGHNNAGLFSNDDEIAARLIETGKAVGEEVWRMPLGDAYDRDIDSDAADVKNIGGGRAAGSVTAAQFLQRFVDKVPWAHLDIAGMAWSSKDAATVPKGATAFGVRLLDRFVARYYEDE
ncbi:MAG TPA: leucyl aminopeptidase [Stellaceae bacterium]|jgi:leucyl aminopeptidase|nr:leucyl aminopeptidase [Stellaceae bacterium]